MFQYFYNHTLKKLTLAFGGLFDEIYVSKETSTGMEERKRVPLTYSGKEKFVRRLTEASSISNNVKIETMLPRLAFELTNIQYDPQRKVNKINKKVKTVGTGAEATTYQSFVEVPYNVQYYLHVFARNVDDSLQIVEQVIPYFSPEFVVTLKMNELDTKIDVPIVLNNVSFNDQFTTGDFSTRRELYTSLQFTAKAYIYSKIKESDSGIIKEMNIDILEDDTL